MIALDFMGGDHGPDVTIPAALEAASRGIPITVVGDRARLPVGTPDRLHAAGVAVEHAPAAVAPGDRGTASLQTEAPTSIRAAADLVRSGAADALVSMGNTGAVMANALRILGRLPGVARPALAVMLPGGSRETLFLDAGANADARPAHLLQFAQLGSVFMRSAHGVAAPAVALLSNGEESTKGSRLVQEAHHLLSTSPTIHFVGNVEGRQLVGGPADVIVTDGFTGNVSVKLIEGVTRWLRPDGAGDDRSAALSANRHGAAPLLGVNGAVFVGHGSSDVGTVVTALSIAHQAVRSDLLGAFAVAIGEGGDA